MKIRTWGKLLFIILALIFMINLSKDIIRLWRAGDRLQQAQEGIEELQKENIGLKQGQEYLESPLFFEQQARDKLSMAKSNEIVVVLPQGLENQSQKQADLNEEKEILPVWRQWLALFW